MKIAPCAYCDSRDVKVGREVVGQRKVFVRCRGCGARSCGIHEVPKELDGVSFTDNSTYRHAVNETVSAWNYIFLSRQRSVAVEEFKRDLASIVHSDHELWAPLSAEHER